MSIHIRVCWALFAFLALVIGPARAADEDVIRKAVERGVDYLKQNQTADGLWVRSSSGTIGASALAGLALLECGVAAEDPAIRKLAPALRDGSILLSDTYSISLCILFFDRLGDSRDVPLIESLTVRLLGGQSADGGWTYQCPNINEAEAARLRKAIKQPKGKDPKQEPSEKKRTLAELPPEIQQQLQQAERLRQEGGGAPNSDNSNTQFATLALWVGHRYGLPVAVALARLEARFRNTQNADGGWSYTSGGVHTGSSPAMICAGLLGLATAYGLVNEAKIGAGKPRDPGRDISVRAGLVALGSLVGLPQQPLGPGLVLDGGPKPGGTNGYLNYYFLWSLERVAVIYGLQTMGKKDWYSWGAAFALVQQRSDGSWSGGYPEGGVDTSFALLFLRRSNLFQDLSSSLRGKVNDPGEVALRAGGLGGTLAKSNSPAEPAKEGNSNSLASKLPNPDQFARRNNRSPRAPLDPESARLSAELVQAAPTQQDALLEKLEQGKGLVYTEALAAAIPQLAGARKTKARDALAERMARMTAATLEDKLQEEDLEIRRAAALACAMKQEKKFIPHLIRLLEDPEPPVVRGAHAALKALTGQDHGPVPDASRAENAKAIAAWKSWWTKQGGALLPTDQSPAEIASIDRELLQGTWVATGLEREGKAMPKPTLESLHIKLIFNGDKLTFEYPDHTELGTFKLEVSDGRKTIDVATGVDTSKGIYQLEGDSLKICGVPSSEERPTDFTTRARSKQVLFILKRQKP
ncbi:MAG TPA: TIGR03067 domain-containing protein [Gemmataceae bacterium]|nr:TIGR03067 domain-containing protein [Gemmataceae bacterium]